jgi:hypothetical protein
MMRDCSYAQRDEDPEENYSVTLTGDIYQEGKLTVQPTATTALTMFSESMTFSGTVYDPPSDYYEQDCVVMMGQDDDRLTGSVCGRLTGTDL